MVLLTLKLSPEWPRLTRLTLVTVLLTPRIMRQCGEIGRFRSPRQLRSLVRAASLPLWTRRIPKTKTDSLWSLATPELPRCSELVVVPCGPPKGVVFRNLRLV